MIEPRPTPKAYGAFARTLHWLTALLIVAQFVIGWTMPHVHHDMPPDGPMAWHLSVGAAIIAVMVVRLGWRITHRPPAAELPIALRRMAGATHGLLYMALIVVPVLGWATASSHGWIVKLFGLIPYPSLVADDSPLGEGLGELHGALAWALFAMIVLHVLAALFHRFVRRDGVMQRMI